MPGRESQKQLLTFCCLFSLQGPGGEAPLASVAAARTLQSVSRWPEELPSRMKRALGIKTSEGCTGPAFTLSNTQVVKLHLSEKPPFQPLGAASQTASWKAGQKPLALLRMWVGLLPGAGNHFHIEMEVRHRRDLWHLGQLAIRDRHTVTESLRT